MFLKSTGLTLSPDGVLKGDDAIYSTFNNTQRVRVLSTAFSGGTAVVHVADLRSPGGFLKIPKAVFEREFALEVKRG